MAPTFPLHVLIYEALDWEQPIWVHLSVFLNPSGKGKMSKRDTGVKGIYVLDIKQMGYLPEGLLNWIALMGWSYDDHSEFFTLEELIEKFSLQKLHPSPAAVDYKKLDHFNGNHIRSLTTSELVDRLRPCFEREGLVIDEEIFQQIAPLVQVRIRTLEEAVEIAGFFFREVAEPEPSELIGRKMTIEESQMEESVEVTTSTKGVTIGISSDISFPSGSAELKQGIIPILEKIVPAIEGSYFQVAIEGHTDNVPIPEDLLEKYPTNWELSGARAASVVREFINLGVNPIRLQAVGYGEFVPRDRPTDRLIDEELIREFNATPEYQARNRRVEITFLAPRRGGPVGADQTELPKEEER